MWQSITYPLYSILPVTVASFFFFLGGILPETQSNQVGTLLLVPNDLIRLQHAHTLGHSRTQRNFEMAIRLFRGALCKSFVRRLPPAADWPAFLL